MEPADWRHPQAFTQSGVAVSALDSFAQGAVGRIAFGKYTSPDYMVHPGEYIPTVGTLTGTPKAYGSNEVYFNLFLPSTPEPPAGFPVAIIAHGGGNSKDDTPYQLAASCGHFDGLGESAVVGVAQPAGPRLAFHIVRREADRCPDLRRRGDLADCGRGYSGFLPAWRASRIDPMLALRH